MKEVWKVRLHLEDVEKIRLPRGAEFLCVHVQNEFPCLWALVDPEEEKEVFPIYLHGTGHPVDERAKKYIGTFLIGGGTFVGHVFAGDPV